MQARYYDPVIGRFMSNDPIGVRDVHSFNRYAYANNNPYKYTDPFGMSVHNPFEPTLQNNNCGCSSALSQALQNMFKDSEDGETEGSDDSEEVPEIHDGHQDKHKEGTPNHKSALKNDPDDPKSTWDNPEEADDLTREAWKKGKPFKGNPKIRIWDAGRRVGTKGDRSAGQSGVKVVKSKNGKIHGHPFGILRIL